MGRCLSLWRRPCLDGFLSFVSSSSWSASGQCFGSFAALVALLLVGVPGVLRPSPAWTQNTMGAAGFCADQDGNGNLYIYEPSSSKLFMHHAWLFGRLPWDLACCAGAESNGLPWRRKCWTALSQGFVRLVGFVLLDITSRYNTGTKAWSTVSATGTKPTSRHGECALRGRCSIAIAQVGENRRS